MDAGVPAEMKAVMPDGIDASRAVLGIEMRARKVAEIGENRVSAAAISVHRSEDRPERRSGDRIRVLSQLNPEHRGPNFQAGRRESQDRRSNSRAKQ
jgi:hypothetical protein